MATLFTTRVRHKDAQSQPTCILSHKPVQTIRANRNLLTVKPRKQGALEVRHQPELKQSRPNTQGANNKQTAATKAKSKCLITASQRRCELFWGYTLPTQNMAPQQNAPEPDQHPCHPSLEEAATGPWSQQLSSCNFWFSSHRHRPAMETVQKKITSIHVRNLWHAQTGHNPCTNSYTSYTCIYL